MSTTCRPRPGGKRVTPMPLPPTSPDSAAVPPATEPGSPGSPESELNSASASVNHKSLETAAVRKSGGGGGGGATLQQRPAVVPVAVTAGGIAAPAPPPRQHKAVFEAEMHDWASQILKELTALSSGGSSGGGGASHSDFAPLQRLAAELALVASAAQAGTRAHVLGRSRGMASPPQAFLGQVLRHWGLQLPFLLLAKLTEQDTHIAWGIPEAKLLEVGLIYKL